MRSFNRKAHWVVAGWLLEHYQVVARETFERCNSLLSMQASYLFLFELLFNCSLWMNDNHIDNELSASTKSDVILRYFSCMHLLMGFLLTYISVIFSKSSDYGLGGIMQRSLHMHAYRAHFFVLSMIFMQIPAVPYLCSQLPTGTKGLCKQLQQANRFHPLQKNH